MADLPFPINNYTNYSVHEEEENNKIVGLKIGNLAVFMRILNGIHTHTAIVVDNKYITSYKTDKWRTERVDTTTPDTLITNIEHDQSAESAFNSDLAWITGNQTQN
jgi:hypothetical protein